MDISDNSGRISPHFLEMLLRGICHDVGAPARHVVQFSQMLNSQLPDNEAITDKHKQWLELIHTSGLQMQAMLTTLTEVTQLSRSASKITRLNLDKIFNEQHALLQANLPADADLYELSKTGEWPALDGCEQHWRSLLSYLLDNAFKFHDKNDSSKRRIKVHCEQLDDQVLFTIEDNGLGIREAQREDIVRAFKKLNSDEDYPGLGMGLTFCLLIADLNDGKLSFEESELGGLKVSYRQAIKRSLSEASE